MRGRLYYIKDKNMDTCYWCHILATSYEQHNKRLFYTEYYKWLVFESLVANDTCFDAEYMLECTLTYDKGSVGWSTEVTAESSHPVWILY
jgi:hypothetical protein